MTDKEYLNTQNAMVKMAVEIAHLDIEGFLNRISNAQTVAPLIDSSLYQRAHANLVAIKNMAEAMREVQAAVEPLRLAVLSMALRESKVTRNDD